MSLQKEIENVCEAWATLLSDDLKTSLDQALKEGGAKRPQFDLTFFPRVKVSNEGGVSIQIEASGDYWDYIEQGVDGTKVKHGSPYAYTKGAVDFDPIESWIKRSSINAPKILADIQLKSTKYSRLTKTGQRLSKPKKKLSYDESVNRLSRVFAVAIARDGHEPKPYIDRVLNSDRIAVLTESLSEVIGREIIASFDNTGDFKTVKIEI